MPRVPAFGDEAGKAAKAGEFLKLARTDEMLRRGLE
jgi:hypothetical protein